MFSKTNILISLYLFIFNSQLYAYDFGDLFETLNPSVVVLYTFSATTNVSGGNVVTKTGLGTGVVINEKGWILTAAHVVHTQDAVHVEFIDGTKKLGKVIASEPMADIALLEVEALPEGIEPVTLGDSDKVRVGNEIMVIGSPYGYKHTLSTGHISGRHAPAHISTPFFEGEFFQTDAAINQGNSGGPMFNLDGELIAIISYIQSKSGGYEGIGFAVTSNTVKKVLLQGKQFWTGIKAMPITTTLASMINYPLKYGALVQSVADGSPSHDAGIQGGSIEVRVGKNKIKLGGDVLVSVGGVKIKGKESLSKINDTIKSIKPGSAFTATIYRKGQFINIHFNKP